MGFFPDHRGRVSISDFKDFDNFYPFGYVLKNNRYIEMQYIGKNDIKGVEIYRCDVVKNEDEELGVIIWNDNKCRYEIEYENKDIKQIFGWYDKRLKVIGNKHKDPELLGKFSEEK